MFNTPSTRVGVLLAGLLLLTISVLMGIVFGATDIPIPSLLYDADSHAALVIWQIRLPRVLLALAVGTILGITGAATQGLFRNPLADPSLIGVTAGAAAGAALMIFFASDIDSIFFGTSLMASGAFIGGSLTVFIVYRLSSNEFGTSVATMLLAGIAVSALAAGLSSLVEYFADNDMLRRISVWRMGGLDGASYTRVSLGLLVALSVMVTLMRYPLALNAMLLGESEARFLGINVQQTKSLLIVFVALGVASSVALAGTIAFIGLVVPHIVRMLIGPDHRWVLPLSALGGGILLVLADLLARTIVAPIELPVGLVTAFIGAPFFISLLAKRRQYGF